MNESGESTFESPIDNFKGHPIYCRTETEKPFYILLGVGGKIQGMPPKFNRRIENGFWFDMAAY
ncbi:MAG: hypothetical protein ACPGED_06380 [Flavobacteriales bacterium]